MARPLGEYFGTVFASDIHDYGYGQVMDFLATHCKAEDFVITNPPFKIGEQFAVTANFSARRGVALLVRTAFLESVSRYDSLFSKRPPTDVLQFVERVPMFKGRVDRHGSTATSYCWLVWRKHAPSGTHFHWLAPCRKRLERDEDYAPSRDDRSAA